MAMTEQLRQYASRRATKRLYRAVPWIGSVLAIATLGAVTYPLIMLLSTLGFVAYGLYLLRNPQVRADGGLKKPGLSRVR